MDLAAIRYGIEHPSQSPGFVRAAKFEYAVKGVAYSLIGAIALLFAFGGGDSARGTRDGVGHVIVHPVGHMLLVVTGVALFVHAFWRLLEAGMDLRARGDTPKGIATRVAYAASGLVNFAVGVLALQVAYSPVSAGSGTRDWFGALLSAAPGRAVLIVLGFAAVAFGVHQIQKGWRERFLRDLRIGSILGQRRRRIIRAGRLGYVARGIALPIVGGFLLQAAIDGGMDRGAGVGGTLQAIVAQPFGAFMIGVVAFGLACYGVYEMLFAKYGRLVR
ncbi:MAG TPA: DUF1206 domain-containing protein [Polyangiaceae bacterium]|nr:DUF1206 domain-containing protein [Polyangiaceae bacterium]